MRGNKYKAFKRMQLPWIAALILTSCLGTDYLSAQNIGINSTGTAPAASAVLDVDATNKGLLLPRLSSSQRNAISSPVAGLFIYNASGNDLEYWNGNSWIQLSGTSVIATNPTGTNTGRSVAISANGSAPNQSSILDIQSTTGGLLIPRMSNTQRDAIISPVNGLIVFNASTNLLDFYSSTGWKEICGSSVSSVTGATITINNVGINTASPSTSAILDITSTTSGLAIPRLTSTQRDAILSPAAGLIIFNTTTQSPNVYIGSNSWIDINPVGSLTAPVAGTHVALQTQITWKWNAVTDATGYKWSTTNNYNTATDNGANISYTQTGLVCNTADSLYVWAYNACGNSQATKLTQVTAVCSSCGSPIVDARDGKIYNTVQIGTQCWMADNLNYGIFIDVSNQSPTFAQKYCFNNDPTVCDTVGFGGLYQWSAIMNGSLSCNGTDSLNPACATPVQGICPAGWHIPSQFEFTLLERNVGTSPGSFPYDTVTVGWLGVDEDINLRCTSFTGIPPSWASGGGAVPGTNLSGFNAYDSEVEFGGAFINFGYISTYFWSSTGSGSTNVWSRSLWHNFGGVRRSADDKSHGYSVRCVKN